MQLHPDCYLNVPYRKLRFNIEDKVFIIPRSVWGIIETKLPLHTGEDYQVRYELISGKTILHPLDWFEDIDLSRADNFVVINFQKIKKFLKSFLISKRRK